MVMYKVLIRPYAVVVQYITDDEDIDTVIIDTYYHKIEAVKRCNALVALGARSIIVEMPDEPRYQQVRDLDMAVLLNLRNEK